MLKVLSIFGTRPEAIKMAPVVLSMLSDSAVISTTCVTGQHRFMLDQVLELFSIPVDFDLAVMTPNQSLNGLAARIISGFDDVLDKVRPDYVLVHGDTTSAMAASLTAFNRGIKVGHVEAGLRTYDISKPWPEEMNRRVIDVVSTYCFAPTQMSSDNLAAEHLGGKIVITGNTVIDALQETVGRIRHDDSLRSDLEGRFSFIDPARKTLLVTGHRRESFGDGFTNICKGLAALSERSDLQIVYPVHLNPNVDGPVRELLGARDNIHLIAPQAYLDFVYLMERADIILTDSGGVQEEAPSLGKPVLVMRDVTERPEAVAAGTVKLVGTDSARIVAETTRLLDEPEHYARFARVMNPYGDGHAAKRIADTLLGRAVTPFSAG